MASPAVIRAMGNAIERLRTAVEHVNETQRRCDAADASKMRALAFRAEALEEYRTALAALIAAEAEEPTGGPARVTE